MLEMTKTPQQIVSELDEYVIGQQEAKRAVAVALYNRYRRLRLPENMQADITPKNLMMIGPTGVGKTEIARRLAKIVAAPFVKVEATKFTEVGYVGRDVEQMVRDLVDVSVHMVEEEYYSRVRGRASEEADKKLVKLLVPGIKHEKRQATLQDMMAMISGNGNQNQDDDNDDDGVTDAIRDQRLSVKEQLSKGLLEDREVTIQMDEAKPMSGAGDMMGQMGIDMGDMLGNLLPKKQVTRTMSVKEAREVLIRQESSKLVNHDDIYSDAIKRAENTGIIFIDEFDKIAAGNKRTSGEVSREGVQRDILPIVEGSQVNTKYGMISTDHILFIASGAFADTKPSDLIAELQGRFPIRVELDDLTKDDFVRILTEPNNSLIKQYIALIGVDDVHLTFTKEAIDRIAEIAYNVNHTVENIGARRLATILEKLLEEVSFSAPDMAMGDITVTAQYVNDRIGKITADKDLTQFIL
ncbi:ATP-dependent protease ATPase subunit HslU [Schleiferilactobacillus shenzhenensis]|uniref:ATP-dependent protease ATPase subunit HslU n=1 Tax=Schleiferilactobacillus shenzhenensis LY-73 TaxID=1231336 RepID=U4TXQ0_9LACO|nr:ATP-dependent protease ATPase subunit HslU [Schleiferilactobacillus shenzhenensis]ERL66593.1 HslU [Schleiferilactobacillus shenzhenensis LY-73]